MFKVGLLMRYTSGHNSEKGEGNTTLPPKTLPIPALFEATQKTRQNKAAAPRLGN